MLSNVAKWLKKVCKVHNVAWLRLFWKRDEKNPLCLGCQDFVFFFNTQNGIANFLLHLEITSIM